MAWRCSSCCFLFFSLFALFKKMTTLWVAHVCVCVWILNMWKVLCANVCLTLECKQTVFLRARVKTEKNRKDWKVRWDVLLLTGETHRPGHEGLGPIVFTQSEGVQYWEWIWKVLNYWSFFPPLLLHLFPLLHFSSQNKHARLVFTWGRKRARISFKQKLEEAR